MPYGCWLETGHDLTGHVARVVGREEHDHVGHLPRLGVDDRTPRGPTSSASSSSVVTLARLACMARLGATAFTRTPCGAGLDRGAARERHHAGLRGGVVRLLGLRAPADHRRVVDDHTRGRSRTCG